MSAQLPLGIQLRDDATLDNFLFTPALAQLASQLDRLVAGDGARMLFLHGAAGTGRSHLLQAVCHGVGAGRALYLPLEQLTELCGSEVLADIEQLELVCLDNVDSIAGRQEWEEALFHFYNRARDQQCRLLCSAAQAPRQLPLELADLRSRLGWELVFHLPGPTDEERLDILRFRARRRGLELSEDVARYVMTRAERGLPELMGLLDRLDRDSLVQQRSLSIPFIKQSLGW